MIFKQSILYETRFQFHSDYHNITFILADTCKGDGSTLNTD